MSKGKTKRLAMLGFLLLSIGCGYRAGALMPNDIQTVSIQILNNETFWRGLEVTLSREIANEIASRTPLILSEREDADALLKGTILSFRKAVLLEDIRDNALESAVIAVVEVEFIDLRTNETLNKFVIRTDPNKSSFTEQNTLVAAVINESFADMAERIVYKIQGGF